MVGNAEKDENIQATLDELISLPKAAEISSISHSHLRLLIRRGEIWGKKLGRDWFTTVEVVNQYLAENHHPGPKSKKILDR